MARSNDATSAKAASGITVIFALLLVALTSATAMASTYYNVDCYCDPATQVDGTDAGGNNYCVCEQDYTLGKLATKEFRFRCKSDNSWPNYMEVNIDGLRAETTCTISVEVTDYISKSCTNWSMTHTDTIQLKTQCSLKYDPPNPQITD